jgi:4-diphosphocytidyl-2-C-methyl-D-erythritol kinase
MFALGAPAKINWFLHVLGKGEDGYHDIRSFMERITLSDTLSFEESASLEVVTEAPIPPGENLVLKAARLLKERAETPRGARITLTKRIPLAAGLGGGSSDAAATLAGLSRLWDVSLSRDTLHELAASLGSDVPVFLEGPAAVVEGRGEKVSPVALTRSWPLLLVKPPLEVSAGWAYGNLRTHSQDVADAGDFIEALEAGDAKRLKTLMTNALEEPVVRQHPVVGDIRGRLLENGALAALMSGSGPTVFGVFRDRKEAEHASLSFSGYWTAVAETEV